MFFEKYLNVNLSDMIGSKDSFKPFTSGCDRRKWGHLPGELKEKIISEGEKYLEFDWPVLLAVRYMDFTRYGNRSRYEKICFQRRYALGALLTAECVESSGRFTDQIINGIWCICEESSWVVPAHNNQLGEERVNSLPNMGRPYIDLFAAETGSLLSWTYYLLKNQLDEVTPHVCERIASEVKRRILDPYLANDHFWWMGFTDRKVNNWNPWCNSNCLTAFLVLEENRERRIQAVRKCMKSLDKFIAVYHDDGGCDEGPGYWNRAGGSLFDCLELLYCTSDGKINVYNEEKIRNIGRFIYRAHISDDYYVNFADASAKINLYSSQVYLYGLRTGDEHLTNHGMACFNKFSQNLPVDKWYSMNRVITSIFNNKEMMDNSAEFPYVRDVWLEGIQVMAVREKEGSAKGLYLAAKGGHNNESHNHNDIGQFIVYSDGKPAIIDIGVETYTAKTFGSRRYEIWIMQSAYHNLPMVNGVQQKPGEKFRASEINHELQESEVRLSLDISTAYPEEAGIESWVRSFLFHRGQNPYIEISDDFSLYKPSRDIILSLMSACEPDVSIPGVILLPAEGARTIRLEYPVDHLAASFEKIDIEDVRLKPVWGASVYRTVLKSLQAVSMAKWSMKISQKE